MAILWNSSVHFAVERAIRFAVGEHDHLGRVLDPRVIDTAAEVLGAAQPEPTAGTGAGVLSISRA